MLSLFSRCWEPPRTQPPASEPSRMCIHSCSLCAFRMYLAQRSHYGVLNHLRHRPPWWPSGEESTCQCRRHGFDPWVRKILWRRKWQPTLVFLPGKSYEQRSLVGYSLWSHKRVWYCNATKQQQSIHPAFSFWEPNEWLLRLLDNSSVVKIKYKEWGIPTPPYLFPCVES